MRVSSGSRLSNHSYTGFTDKPFETPPVCM